MLVGLPLFCLLNHSSTSLINNLYLLTIELFNIYLVESCMQLITSLYMTNQQLVQASWYDIMIVCESRECASGGRLVGYLC